MKKIFVCALITPLLLAGLSGCDKTEPKPTSPPTTQSVPPATFEPTLGPPAPSAPYTPGVGQSPTPPTN